MTIILSFLWLIWLAVSLFLVYQFVGMRLMLSYFPEGRRWWVAPMQVLSLACFVACVLCHPWGWQ